ncbi:MAG: SMC-Scp complex subunit ScpB [Oscillospiraceae bacterium]|nr:SMC-Scp complex subunit ScpB [Oscillospiraceae bacterium]
MNLKQLKKEMLAILFAAGEPVEAARIAAAMNVDEETVYKTFLAVNDMLDEAFPFTVLTLGSSYQMVVGDAYSGVVRSALESRRAAPLSQAAMEVLAIIAYNQPVTKSFIEQVRGVDSSSVVNSLVEKGLVDEAGRLELPGRPLAYATSPHFLRTFGISSLADLPAVPSAERSAEGFAIEEE